MAKADPSRVKDIKAALAELAAGNREREAAARGARISRSTGDIRAAAIHNGQYEDVYPPTHWIWRGRRG